MNKCIEPAWAVPARVRALTTLRETDLGAIAQLFALPQVPRWLQQVHGVDVVDLDAQVPFPDAPTPVADASITRAPGVVCAIRTADCLPVLLAASDGSAVGAAHAGWRGLAAGVLEATIDKLRAGSARESALVAWLGPAISAAHFEVGDEVRAAFMQHHAAAEMAFVRNPRGRWQCDLYLLARQRLETCGVTDISGGGLCTYADSARFYSYRRDVQHDGQATTGRMATLIWIESAP
ncbi:MAG: peptidoglycan editing factor PgeF [Pseudomonadota bacterium]